MQAGGDLIALLGRDAAAVLKDGIADWLAANGRAGLPDIPASAADYSHPRHIFCFDYGSEGRKADTFREGGL